MSKFKLFRRQVSLDTPVTLRLTRGADVSGRVTEIDEDHVCVAVGQRTVTIFEDILAGWEIHQGQVIDPAANGEPITSRTPDLHPQLPEQKGDFPQKPFAPSSPSDPAIIERRAQIYATYSEGVKRAQLEPVEPDFSFSEEEFPPTTVSDIRGKWNKARSQYEYALKIHEESRITSIVGHVLRPLVKRYPKSSALHGLLASLLLKTDQKDEAIKHFRTAVQASRRPQHWYGLAYAATGTALECYALRNYFLVTQIDKNHDAWLRYLRIITDYPDPSGIVRILEQCLSRPGGDSSRERAAETLIYLLWSLESPESSEKATRSFLRGEAFHPEEWRNTLLDSMPVTDPNIAQEEVHDLAPQEPSKKLPSVPSGRIVSFGSQGFGFIETRDATYFFRIDDVVDEGLKQSLLDGSWRTKAQVEFKSELSMGHQYDLAVQIMPPQDADALLQKAQQLRRLNQHSQAIALVRRAAMIDPGYQQQTQELEAELKNDIQRLGIGLPKGSGPYARAKRAQLVDQDFVTAEKLLRIAIEREDKPESATKDLASLLQQQGRSDDALKLLESKRQEIKDATPYNNMLASLYQQIGYHSQAISLLENLADKADGRSRASLLRRIAFSYFKSSRYDDAEHKLKDLLNEQPGDRLAERWLAGLEEARRVGSYDEAAEIIGEWGALVEQGIDLSPLADEAIKTCAFEGVEPSKLQSGTLGSKDVEHLEDLAKRLGTRRPRERAAFYLSAAAILSRDSSEETAGRIYSYLRRYFASMGDAAWSDKRPADVVRTYYVESLALVSNRRLDEAWRILARYLATFCATSAEEIEGQLPRGPRGQLPLADYIASLQSILKKIWSVATEAWHIGLLEAYTQSNFVAQAINDVIKDDTDVRALFASLLEVQQSTAAQSIISDWKSKSEEFSKARSNVLLLCETQTRHQLAVASMEDMISQLSGIERSRLSEFDQRRLRDVLDIVSSSLQFCKALDFEEKEQHYWTVTRRSKDLAVQIKSDPTRISFSAFFPIADHLNSLTEEAYAETARTSGAQLSLQLLVNEYTRSNEGKVKLQFEVKNKEGCSPASSVRLIWKTSKSHYLETTEAEQEVATSLRGGSSNAVVTHVILTPTDAAMQERAFPITVYAGYRNRIGEECQTEETEWTVRLYAENEFREIPNKYAPYAEGGPVDDPEMFVGRDSISDSISDSLLSGSASKCIVMFGQKRAGKSSLLEHLKRRLACDENCVPVQFSLYDLGSPFTEAQFFNLILTSIFDACEDRSQGELITDNLTLPSAKELVITPTSTGTPTMQFHAAIKKLIHSLRDAQKATQPRVVLLIDEFTELYKQICKEKISRDFMKAWKAIVEKRYFASVIVGQDIMPNFKAEFPNEFGVTEDRRVTYLSENDARRLIEEPIGRERFAGNAVTRLLDLTAGSPYYTMMFCNRLVEYMNRTHSAVVTEADIANIKDDMISGNHRLERDKFDNLICAGDGVEDSGIEPEETFQLCKAIAKQSERGWCSLDALRDSTEGNLQTLLIDLKRRDVVEQERDNYRLHVGLFRDWLLSQG